MLEIIAQRRREDRDYGDLLSMLLAVRDEETGEGMNDEQLRDEVLTLILAGHETTATALSWIWYLLSQHPEVEAKLHAELDEVLGGRAPAMSDLANLNYTGMVVDEAMRIFPPVWAVGRAAINATKSWATRFRRAQPDAQSVLRASASGVLGKSRALRAGTIRSRARRGVVLAMPSFRSAAARGCASATSSR